MQSTKWDRTWGMAVSKVCLLYQESRLIWLYVRNSHIYAQFVIFISHALIFIYNFYSNSGRVKFAHNNFQRTVLMKIK